MRFIMAIEGGVRINGEWINGYTINSYTING
jgi:hypothetical protein